MKFLNFCVWAILIAIINLHVVQYSYAVSNGSFVITPERKSYLRNIGLLKKFGLNDYCFIRPITSNLYGVVKKDLFIPYDSRKKSIGSRLVQKIQRSATIAATRCKNFLSSDSISTPLPTSVPTLISNEPSTNIQPTIPTPLSTPSYVPTAPSTAIPSLAKYEEQMITYGKSHCNNLDSSEKSFDEKLLSTYYDAEWVYYQIYDYTKDTSWLNCAKKAGEVYRDNYVIPANSNIPGYWNFTHGLVQDYLRTGDIVSKNTALELSQNAAFSRDSTPVEDTVDATYSREVAYAITSYLQNENLGQTRRARLSILVDQALGHLDQWFVLKTASYIRPFMVALTSQALIEYYEKTGDARVVPALERAADWMWDNVWINDAKAFRYTDRTTEYGSDEMDPAPDLNLLIVPLYGFLYHETGNIRHLNRGDEIFSGGVQGAWLGNGKQFDQNYRWSMKYIEWRTESPKF